MIDRMNVTDPVGAALLGAERSRHIVLALVADELSQSDLARRLGMSASLLHHHVTRLLRAGLIAVTLEEPRRGRSVRHYRAVARSFFVPAELAAALPNRSLLGELAEALERVRAGAYRGLLFEHHRGPRMRIVRDASAAPPSGELWHRMTLRDGDATALMGELRDLFARYEARQAADGRPYLMLGAIAPA